MVLVSVPTLLSLRCFNGGKETSTQKTKKKPHLNDLTAPPPAENLRVSRAEQNNTPNLGALGCLALHSHQWLSNYRPSESG